MTQRALSVIALYAFVSSALVAAIFAASSLAAPKRVTKLPASSSATKAQPNFVATSPVLTFGSDGFARTTVQILNPGPATSVGFELVLIPTCTTAASETTVMLNADGVTTLSLTFQASFDTSLTGASLVLIPQGASIPPAGACGPQGVTLASNNSTVTSATSATTATITASSLSASSPPASTPGSTSSSTSSSASLVASQPQAEVIVLSLRRLVSTMTALWWPLIAGVIFGFVVIALSLGKGAMARLKQNDTNRWVTEVKAGSAWSFKDSFATNVTAIGALLAGALAAAGSTSTLLPGIETSRFVLLSAMWGGLAAIVPLVVAFGTYTATVGGDAQPPGGGPVAAGPLAQVAQQLAQLAQQLAQMAQPQQEAQPPQPPQPLQSAPAPQPATAIKTWAMAIGMLLTLIAVGAELWTLGVLASMSATSSTTHAAIGVVVAVLGVLVALYAIFTTGELIRTQPDPTNTTRVPYSKLNAFANTSLTL